MSEKQRVKDGLLRNANTGKNLGRVFKQNTIKKPFKNNS